MYRIAIGGVATLLLVTGCLAPEAKPIPGDVGTAIEKGIAEGSGGFDHGRWDAIVRTYTRDDGHRFDYVGLKREEDELDFYLGDLDKVDLSSLAADEIEALFINAYNAYTVKTVLEHVSSDGSFTVESIRDIPDVFDRANHHVGGFSLSLNNIEHNILRPFFKDARIHFSVNCASVSCPPLPTHALSGPTVQHQLDTAARGVLASPDYVRVEGSRLEVSRLLDWYGADFVTEGWVGAAKDLATYIGRYTREDVRKWIESHPSAPIEFMRYDWTLNRAR